MALWGVSTADESKPKWLTDGNPVGDKQDCFATSAGWVLRHYTNTARTTYYDEVLVAVKNLSGATKLAAADISAAYFKASSYDQGDTGTVVVVYNEQVTVSGSPTLAVTGSVTGTITATAADQTGTNQIEFTFTVPSQTETLSIGAQSISGGTLVDYGTSTNSDTSIATGNVIGAGGSGTTKTIAVA